MKTGTVRHVNTSRSLFPCGSLPAALSLSLAEPLSSQPLVARNTPAAPSIAAHAKQIEIPANLAFPACPLHLHPNTSQRWSSILIKARSLGEAMTRKLDPCPVRRTCTDVGLPSRPSVSHENTAGMRLRLTKAEAEALQRVSVTRREIVEYPSDIRDFVVLCLEVEEQLIKEQMSQLEPEDTWGDIGVQWRRAKQRRKDYESFYADERRQGIVLVLNLESDGP